MYAAHATTTVRRKRLIHVFVVSDTSPFKAAASEEGTLSRRSQLAAAGPDPLTAIALSMGRSPLDAALSHSGDASSTHVLNRFHSKAEPTLEERIPSLFVAVVDDGEALLYQSSPLSVVKRGIAAGECNRIDLSEREVLVAALVLARTHSDRRARLATQFAQLFHDSREVLESRMPALLPHLEREGLLLDLHLGEFREDALVARLSADDKDKPSTVISTSPRSILGTVVGDPTPLSPKTFGKGVTTSDTTARMTESWIADFGLRSSLKKPSQPSPPLRSFASPTADDALRALLASPR